MSVARDPFAGRAESRFAAVFLFGIRGIVPLRVLNVSPVAGVAVDVVVFLLLP